MLEEHVLDLDRSRIRGAAPEADVAAPTIGHQKSSVRSFYLESLRTENIRLLADQEVSFRNEDGSPRMWTVFVGDNGLCKTTLLQMIVLAASGERLSKALVDDADAYRNVRRKNQKSALNARFLAQHEGGKRETLDISLETQPGRHDFRAPNDWTTVSGADLIADIRDTRARGYFLSAYGVGRFLTKPGEVAIPEDLHKDRVEGLFDERHKMLGCEFFEALRSKNGENAATKFRTLLKSSLADPHDGEGSLLKGISGLDNPRPSVGDEQHTSWNIGSLTLRYEMDGEVYHLPPTAFSHGYQSVIAWISDLIGHGILEFGEGLELEGLSGIVLIDEIDLHLHPSWQRRIVPILKELFPKLQFIVTTHSPLVLSGFESDEIIRLELEDGAVVQRHSRLEPGLSLYSETLSSYYGVYRAARPALLEKETRYLELLGYDEHTKSQRAELDKLEQELDQYFNDDDELAGEA